MFTVTARAGLTCSSCGGTTGPLHRRHRDVILTHASNACDVYVLLALTQKPVSMQVEGVVFAVTHAAKGN